MISSGYLSLVVCHLLLVSPLSLGFTPEAHMSAMLQHAKSLGGCLTGFGGKVANVLKCGSDARLVIQIANKR